MGIVNSIILTRMEGICQPDEKAEAPSRSMRRAGVLPWICQLDEEGRCIGGVRRVGTSACWKGQVHRLYEDVEAGRGLQQGCASAKRPCGISAWVPKRRGATWGQPTPPRVCGAAYCVYLGVGDRRGMGATGVRESLHTGSCLDPTRGAKVAAGGPGTVRAGSDDPSGISMPYS